MSETLHSLLMGKKFPKGLCLNFSTEYVCSNCGFRAAGPTQSCPVCQSLITVRYLKVWKRALERSFKKYRTTLLDNTVRMSKYRTLVERMTLSFAND